MLPAAARVLSARRLLAAVLAALSTALVMAPAGSDTGSFDHGVASRALARSAILWSRVDTPGEFRYRVSKQKNLSKPVAKGSVTADPEHDNTLKKFVRGLQPSTRYYFRFISDDSQSALGTFRTLPSGARLRDIELAISGDSDSLWDQSFDPEAEPHNDQVRPFEVLDRAREERPHLFVYMGDTIYSDSETGAPLAETIEEKWAKYRDNRLAATQGLLRKVSTWAVWDDHEVVNDFDGAVLDLDDSDLFDAGLGAFHDYWPIPKGRMYRKVDFGRQVDLIFLDERRYRDKSADEQPTPCRDSEGDLDLAPELPQDVRAGLGLAPVDPECLDHLHDPDRTMLGEKQLEWFKRQLRTSDARWKLVINQVPISQLFVRPYDRWEGYAHERNAILNLIDKRSIRGVVFLTTDLHANAGARVYKDIRREGAKPVTYEMITGPIQTCTLDCEVDHLLGFGSAGEILQATLINNDLVDADCVHMDHYAYGLVSTLDKADRLKLEWKSHTKHPDDPGGQDVPGCKDKRLKPSASG